MDFLLPVGGALNQQQSVCEVCLDGLSGQNWGEDLGSPRLNELKEGGKTQKTPNDCLLVSL